MKFGEGTGALDQRNGLEEQGDNATISLQKNKFEKQNRED